MKTISKLLIILLCMSLILSGCSNDKGNTVKDNKEVNSEVTKTADKSIDEESVSESGKTEEDKAINDERKKNDKEVITETNKEVNAENKPAKNTAGNQLVKPEVKPTVKPESKPKPRTETKPEKKKVWILDQEAYDEIVDDTTKPIYEYRETWVIYFKDGTVKTYYNKQEWKNAIYANKKNVSSYTDGEDKEVLIGYKKKTLHHEEVGHWEWK